MNETLEVVTLARAIAAEPNCRPHPVAVGRAARQGDVVLRPVAVPAGAAPTTGAAEILAQGRHGAHVAIGDAAMVGSVLVTGAGGAVIAHTDEPHARHAALALAPCGAWTIARVRELDAAAMLPQEVRD